MLFQRDLAGNNLGEKFNYSEASGQLFTYLFCIYIHIFMSSPTFSYSKDYHSIAIFSSQPLYPLQFLFLKGRKLPLLYFETSLTSYLLGSSQIRLPIHQLEKYGGVLKITNSWAPLPMY